MPAPSRYQNFYQDPLTNSFSNQIKILHLPVVEVNGLERRVLLVAVRVGEWTASAGGLQRSEPGFVTADLVGRLDLRPRIALPLNWKGWDAAARACAARHALHAAGHASATNPLGVASGNELNRRDLEARSSCVLR